MRAAPTVAPVGVDGVDISAVITGPFARPPPVIASRGYEIQFLPGDFADIGHQQLAFGVNVMR